MSGFSLVRAGQIDDDEVVAHPAGAPAGLVHVRDQIYREALRGEHSTSGGRRAARPVDQQRAPARVKGLGHRTSIVSVAVHRAQRTGPASP